MRPEPSPHPTDWSRLIAAVGAHRDHAAFRRLFDHFAPRIKTFMRRSGVDEQEAEELAQETMVLLWRKAPLFNPASAGASAWIFTIARNLRIDRLRRQRRSGIHETMNADAEYAVDDAAAPDEALAADEAEARVRAALAVLPQSQKDVVELSFYEEKAHSEIARMLGLPLGTVKSRLRLAMDKLRDVLGNRQ